MKNTIGTYVINLYVNEDKEWQPYRKNNGV